MDATPIRIARQTRPAPHSLPHPPRVMLEIVRGRARRLVRRVMPPIFLIGRAADCDLVLGDEQFPDAFAYVYVRTEGVSVRHLGASPDLLVNGRPVDSAALTDGDRLEMGEYEFQINIQHLDPRGGGIRAHDDDNATVSYDLLALDTAFGQVHHLLAEIRRSIRVPPLDLHIFDGNFADHGSDKKPHLRRPLAGFVARRASA